jgi:chitosanase
MKIRTIAATMIVLAAATSLSAQTVDWNGDFFAGFKASLQGASAPAAVVAAAQPAPAQPAACSATGPMNAAQMHRLYGLTYMFEYSSSEPDYGKLAPMKEGDGDGRAYCTGIIGFCSNTDDLADVIDVYTQLRPGNMLAGFVPTMRMLSAAHSGSVKGLEGLPAAWNAVSDDPLLHQAQETIRDKEYFYPALALADQLGIKTVLGRDVLYDTCVQHGVGGTNDLISRLQKVMPDTPLSGRVSEKDWLLAFLKVRKAELEHASDPATAACWAESAPRADVLSNLILDGNWDYCSPLHLRSASDWDGEVVP